MDYILSRAQKKLCAVNYVKPTSSGVLRLVHQAHILPVLDYCDTVWSPSNSTVRLRPIMLKILPIMLLSNAQKSSLLCSKLCFQNQHYAQELIVL